MAHEKLKAQYAIDKQYSYAPWEWWEILEIEGNWISLSFHPSWKASATYRRKPDAPVWPDDKEDARKWRELVELASESGGISFEKFKEIRDGKEVEELIQGYTEDQWQAIIDGKFLCEFSDIEGFGDNPLIQTLKEIDPFRSRWCLTWNYCRPLRTKGVRQPWFGGECPVDDDALVLARHLDDSSTWYKGTAKNVLWGSTLEFIEL